MTKLLALYGTDENLTLALDSLKKAHGDAIEVDVINELPRETGSVQPVGVMPSQETMGVMGSVALPPSAHALLDLNGEAAAYFRRSVQDGQTLVIVNTDDDYLEPVARILTEHGGKVTRI